LPLDLLFTLVGSRPHKGRFSFLFHFLAPFGAFTMANLLMLLLAAAGSPSHSNAARHQPPMQQAAPATAQSQPPRPPDLRRASAFDNGRLRRI